MLLALVATLGLSGAAFARAAGAAGPVDAAVRMCSNADHGGHEEPPHIHFHSCDACLVGDLGLLADVSAHAGRFVRDPSALRRRADQSRHAGFAWPAAPYNSRASPSFS